MTRSAWGLSILQTLAVLGPWTVIPIYVIAMMLFVSISLLGLAAGAVFGTVTGFWVLSLSTTISAGLVFLAGRYLSRGWVFKKIETSKKIRAVDDMVTQGGWRMVAMLRQTSILPFSLMNYGLGLSKIPFRHYILATWFSMMPGALLQVYLGSLAGEFIFEGRKPQKTMLEWTFFAVGFIVTIAIGIYATKRVKNILDNP